MEVATAAGFCAFLFFFGAAAIGLTGPDEPRYAQIAREMLARNDWVTPHLYGQPWFEKPILYYWSAAISYRLLGVSDWAARMPAAVFATAAVAAIYALLRRFAPGTQLDAVLITASSVALLGFSRSAGPDMLLAACFTIAMVAWLGCHLGASRRWLLAFYFFLALGTLAKGPVAPALAGMVILAFLLLRRDLRAAWATVRQTLWLPGIVLFLLVALPWYVLVQVRNPDFFRVFVLEHNLARFGTDVFRHQQPFWFYLPVLLIGVLPWTVYWAAALVEAGRALGRRDGDAATPAQTIQRFVMVWIAVVVLFFSIAQSKLPGYILPVFPACGILLALYAGTRRDAKSPLWMALLHAFLLAGLIVAVLALPFALAKAGDPPRITAGVLAGLVFGGVAYTLRMRGLRLLRFVTLAPIVVLLAFLLRLAAPALDAKLSLREPAHRLDQIDARRSQLAIYRSPRQVEYGMAFYRDQAVRRYERGEVPAGNHMVIAPAGVEEQLAHLSGGRRVSRVGEYGPQKLVFYWMSPAMAHPPNQR